MLFGCSDTDPNRKVTVPVRGEIYVDGNPADKVQVLANPDGGMDLQQPTLTQATTLEDGSFELSTYAYGDGAPIGSYKLTFTWQNYSPMAGSFQGPDKLKGTYSDPESAEFSLVIEKSSKAVDLGRINLSTGGK